MIRSDPPRSILLMAILLVLAPNLQVPAIPPNLKVPAGNGLFVHVFAKGFQIYRCTLDKADTNHFSWAFVAPAADLYTDAGYTRPAGRHYAGPTWESTDGSKVIGAKLQQANAPDTGAIPWLLLRAAAVAGSGMYNKVTFIQRVNTRGGNVPSTIADRAHLGQEVQIPYTAEYFFYRATVK
jgi:Protein of unknown function (DUF3455)